MVATLEVIRTRLSFILTLMTIFGFFTLSFFKGVDITVVIPTILGLFFASRSATAISHVMNARKDEQCDTAAVIKKLEENS